MAASPATGNVEPLRPTTLIQTIFHLPPHANKSKPEYFSTLRVEYIGNERWQWAVPWSWCCSSTGSFRGIMLRYICEMYYAIQRNVWQRSSEIHFATLVRVSLFWERGCWNTVRVHKGEKCFFLLLLRIFCDIVRLVTSLKKWSNHQCYCNKHYWQTGVPSCSDSTVVCGYSPMQWEFLEIRSLSFTHISDEFHRIIAVRQVEDELRLAQWLKSLFKLKQLQNPYTKTPSSKTCRRHSSPKTEIFRSASTT